MPSIKTQNVKPLAVIAAALGGAGAAKLSAIPFEKRMFAGWGYPDWTRAAVGGIEVGIAATALAGLRDPASRRVAGAATVATMVCAVATHVQAGDPKLTYVPAALLAGTGVAVLLGA